MPATDNRVILVVTETLRRPAGSVKPEHHLRKDLGATSFQLADLIVGLEDEFELDFTAEDLESVATVQDFQRLVAEKFLA